MSDASDYTKASREALRRLRQERSEQVKVANAANNLVRAERKKIVADLASGPMSVRQLATSTQLPTDRVLWHIAAMRKYGDVAEMLEKDGDYYTYSLTAGAKSGSTTEERKTAVAPSDQTDDESGEG
jgi:predicted Rossmann fold nucleotide-binding protein DprA/Smf involved in DNA uptake